MLRQTMSIFAPACDAAYSSPMICSSFRLLTLIRMRAFFPASAAFATSRMRSTSP
jgi:hypothetical protein